MRASISVELVSSQKVQIQRNTTRKTKVSRIDAGKHRITPSSE